MMACEIRSSVHSSVGMVAGVWNAIRDKNRFYSPRSDVLKFATHLQAMTHCVIL